MTCTGDKTACVSTGICSWERVNRTFRMQEFLKLAKTKDEYLLIVGICAALGTICCDRHLIERSLEQFRALPRHVDSYD